MTIRAVLFDLDDTLLGNSMQAFMSRYFALLGEHAQRYLAPDQFLRELLAATRAMMENTDTAVTNRQLFWSVFQQRTGLDPAELEPYFDQFYREKFNLMQPETQLRPVAAELVQTCFERGLKVVIATNPMFPTIAIEQRLAWAGVPIEQFPFDLVTTYDNMHATKPHPVYYEEILSHIGCAPAEALMVGDDWKNDIQPTAVLGLFTYWINYPGNPPPDPSCLTAQGTLEDLYDAIQSGWLEQLRG